MSDALLAALDVFGRYVHAVNRGTAAEVADCFTSDSVLVLSTRSFAGRDAVREFYDDYIVEDLRSRCRAMRHRTSSMTAAASGDVVQAVCYFDVDAHVAEPQTDFWGHEVPADSIVRNAGRYQAAIAVEDEIARFDRLTIITEWVSVRPRVPVAEQCPAQKERA